MFFLVSKYKSTAFTFHHCKTKRDGNVTFRDGLSFNCKSFNTFAPMEKIPVLKFFKRKYGDELLIDLIDIHYMKSGIMKWPVHRYNFYSVVLITDGQEEIALNDNSVMAKRGTLITSTPGDVWHWNPDTQLQGYALDFEEEFLLSFFKDRLFLQKFPYLQHNRRSPFYLLDDNLFERICPVMTQMQMEIHGDEANLRKTSLPEIDQHVLRAMLYETLVLLRRADDMAVTENDVSLNRYVEPFMQLADKHFAEQRNIQFYADRLCITPNYLNKIAKQFLGTNVKSYINDKTLQEIKNLLEYTSLSVAEIAERMHFQSSSYLVRYFKKQVGITPLQYREHEFS